ncbi:MAG: ABC transporter ATP-binding protein [Sulfurovum sp.]|uniref:ABC transporter ATP-binding protein n=1 Tax=Sulfurovum sp. TaxID=1969726 RepID=UPI002867D5D2|nr:ABC transporter ATP-binding protein [Sulfurovum sp.]MCO4845165.1 ABC transporter ATP-binding protein [Sulfurovum sp.]
MIQIENLYRTFHHGSNEVPVLKEINLNICEGECVVLKGVSGSGKTTLLSLIAGLDKPSSGKVLIEGEPISKLPDLFASELRAKKIGMIFQHFNLFEHLSVNENVTIALIPSGLKMKEIHEKVAEALKVANIIHKKETLASRLSGGEKQRTAIARALVADPNIILCDEPTANLDRDNSLLFIDILEKLHRMGKTIVIATHDPLFDSLSFESTIIPMVDGKIV